ncbi:hypothetical protein RIF29_13854 [Crotalaria pallida]|uniref:Uncharacterized protein n=1 Tax=Crotalaria pallida TaxID=3830 RepID=A0AAN9IC79_CROPI
MIIIKGNSSRVCHKPRKFLHFIHFFFLFPSMDPIIFLLLILTSFCSYPLVLIAQSPTISKISVVGVVYCDTCSNNIFSKQSYFLPGVEVHIECKFRATTPKTSEQISFSVNRTTDQYGVYKLEIPSVDGINCVDGSAIVSLCQASLIGSSSSTSCNVPFLKSTTSEISVKSKQDNQCIYTLSALSYKPPQRNTTLCGTSTSSLDSSKFYFPYLPPYVFPWPPFPSIPFPPITPIPSSIPSLPFPFPPTPPYVFSPPPFNLGDPTTWVPYIPSISHPPPPPPPPAFNLGDPRSWIPHASSSPPNIPQNHNNP